MEALFHLVDPAVWDGVGPDYRPESLTTEGFVHCSFAGQVAASADRHYAHAAHLVALELDPARLAADVVVEDSYGSGTAYPHVYGPVPRSAVVAVHPLRRDAAGAWEFSAPGPEAPAG